MTDDRPASNKGVGGDCVSPLYFYFLQQNMQRMQPVLGRGGGGGVGGDVKGGYVMTLFPELF